jgi:hypothetical protein
LGGKKFLPPVFNDNALSSIKQLFRATCEKSAQYFLAAQSAVLTGIIDLLGPWSLPGNGTSPGQTAGAT